MDYVNIDIEITPSTKGSGFYKVDATIKGRVLTNAFRSPRAVSEEVSINLEEWKDLSDDLKSLKARFRGIYDKEESRVKKFGKNLFQQVITGTVYTLYTHGKEFASNKDCGLRLRLQLGSPELVELPWELLYEEGEFLVLMTEHPRILVMRCLKENITLGAVEHHLPLQIMIMTAESKDHPVDAEKEKKDIGENLKNI